MKVSPKNIKIKNKFMLCAFHNGRIVGGLGFVGYQAEFVRKTGSLGMSIQNEFSNSGLGTLMMEYTLELAKEFGFHRVDLTVRTYNSGQTDQWSDYVS